MIKPLQVIVRILQGKVILDDSTDVRIVKREYPIDKTPCITMDNNGTTIIQKNITNKDYVIPETHPQYSISLKEILEDYDYVVRDMVYDSNTQDWNYLTIPVNEITFLSDLDNCIMNLNKTGYDVHFERYSSDEDVEFLTKTQQESLMGLLVGICYDDYQVNYVKISNCKKSSKTISQQVIREERSIDIDLNIWCDNEEERDEITDKISELFYQVQSDHYQFCKNYLNGNCQFLDRSCEATNPNSMRGIKKQCPKPKEYHYQNIFNTYDIIRATFDVAPPYILDDLTTTPPVRRSIIRVSFTYYDYYNIGGAVSKELTVNGELL